MKRCFVISATTLAVLLSTGSLLFQARTQSLPPLPAPTVTVYDSDQILHHIVADDSSFDTGVMNPGATFTVTAGKAGTVISYHCTLHSRVKGKIVVDAAQESFYGRRWRLRNSNVPTPLMVCGPGKNSMAVASGMCICIS